MKGTNLFSDDRYLGDFVEINFFENGQNVDLTVGYPNTGLGLFNVNYAFVYTLQVKPKQLLFEEDTYVFIFVECFCYQEKGTIGSVEQSHGGINQKEFGVQIKSQGSKAIIYYVFFAGNSQN